VKIYSNPAAPASVSSVDFEAGYEAINVANPELDREWRSAVVSNASSNALTVDLGVMTRIRGVLVYGHNFLDPQVVFYETPSLVVRVVQGTVSADREGRRRTMVAVDLFARYVVIFPTVNIASATAELKFTHRVQTFGGNSYAYAPVAALNYSVVAGDSLVIEQWISPVNPVTTEGGCEIEFSGAAPNTGITFTPQFVDQNGVLMRSGPASGAGSWVTRTFSLANIVGRSITKFLVGNEADAAGSYEVRYRNCRIVGTGSVLRATLWSGGRATNSFAGYYANAYDAKLVADGAPFGNEQQWRAGAVHIMQDVADVRAPTWAGGLKKTLINAQSLEVLANKRVSVATLAQPFSELEFAVRNTFGKHSTDPLIDLPRRGLCVLDCERRERPHHVWPVRMIEEQISEQIDGRTTSIISSVKLREVC
jgi:hypothetical protein